MFAAKLAGDQWNYGECDNDIVIFYSVDDKAVSAITIVTELFDQHRVSFVNIESVPLRIMVGVMVTSI